MILIANLIVLINIGTWKESEVVFSSPQRITAIELSPFIRSAGGQN